LTARAGSRELGHMASFVESRQPPGGQLGRRFVFGLPLLFAAAAAGAQDGDLTYPRSSLVITTAGRDLKFEIELALDDLHRSRGLMFRKKLGPYEGMLFDFFQEMPVSFWMKNTLIPLDMLFIAADGTIKHIHPNALPLTTDPIPSQFPVRAVLEINGGSAALLGIKPGDKVKHPTFGNG
jgi:uncharacterized membrane protein (UPF0127 family)